MRPGMTALAAWLVAVVSFAAACGPGSMAACPGQTGEDLLCPTHGSVHVEVTGAEEWTFDAPLDPQSEFRPTLAQSAELIQLAYRDRSKLPTDSFFFGGARATAGPQTVGANLVIHGNGYTTADACTLTLTSFGREGIAGSFTCPGMTPFGLEDSTTLLIDATGTFTASP